MLFWKFIFDLTYRIWNMAEWCVFYSVFVSMFSTRYSFVMSKFVILFFFLDNLEVLLTMSSTIFPLKVYVPAKFGICLNNVFSKGIIPSHNIYIRAFLHPKKLESFLRRMSRLTSLKPHILHYFSSIFFWHGPLNWALLKW